MDSLILFVLAALAALVASVLIGNVLRQIWARHEQQTIDEKWQQRERLLDSPRPVGPVPGIHAWRSRPASTRDVTRAEPGARVLYIVARDQSELFAYLRRDFAAEQAEGVIEILMNRRQRAQPREADGRDPRRNLDVDAGLRQVGFALVSQHTVQLMRAHNDPGGRGHE
jgi:hypothetical protein